MKAVTLAPILLFALAACRTPAPPADVARAIHGIVSDAENRPIAGADVRLGALYRTTTNGLGRFSVGAGRPGEYRLRVAASGYAPLDRSVVVTDRTALLRVHLHDLTQTIDRALTAYDRGDYGEFVVAYQEARSLDDRDPRVLVMEHIVAALREITDVR